LAVAGSSVAETLMFDGSFQVGRAKLDSITLPPTTAQTAGLVGWITGQHSTAAVLDGRPSDAAAAMDAAAELAERFGAAGEVDSLGFLFGPVLAGCFRMYNALETDEPDQVISIAENVHPERDLFVANQVLYWVNYGRALAQLRDRRDDAVRALRTAEDIFPTKVRRDPMVREAIGALLPGAGRDALGMELRGLAYRAGVSV
ncbi:MAG: XRE family transcriptional regulator, partial [Actinomycetes bacterium]